MDDVYGHQQGVLNTGSGALSWTTQSYGAYGAFGAELPTLESGSTLASTRGWRGYRTDPTGFIYMGARYYNATEGRFISPDPFGHAASMDLYSFANGDPINFVDPTGRGAVQGNPAITVNPLGKIRERIIDLRDDLLNVENSIKEVSSSINRAADFDMIKKLSNKAFETEDPDMENYNPSAHEDAARNYGAYVGNPIVAGSARAISEFLYQFPKYTIEDALSRLSTGEPGKYQPYRWSHANGGILDSMQDIRNTMEGAQR